MRIGSMFVDVLTSFFRRPVTEKYPFERHAAPERLRGKLVWDPTKCTGCQLCSKDCPSNAIELITIDKAKKQFVVRYHMDRCTFCAQCVKNCRFKCMGMTSEGWELASLNKEPFTVYYGKDADIQQVLANFKTAPVEEPVQPAE
jgi:formate hydrogenlyase subunit 6/NADH:ubiquinone oxidoreductase subunit I